MGIITILIAPSTWFYLVLSSWLATLRLGRRRRSAAAVAAALQGFFIVPLAITVIVVDCGFTFLVVDAACVVPPMSPGGPPSVTILLPRVVSHPEAPRAAGVLVTGSLGDVVPMASGGASTLGTGWPPAVAAVALLGRAAGAAAHDMATEPRAVGTRLLTCVHIEVFDVTCIFTASAQASSPRSRGMRRTRRRVPRAASHGLRNTEEAPGA